MDPHFTRIRPLHQRQKGVENVVVDHLSRLTFDHNHIDPIPITECFSDKQLLNVSSLPWYANVVNYLVMGTFPQGWTSHDKDRMVVMARSFFYDDLYVFKYCADQIIRRCVPNNEIRSVLSFCHDQACGGHFSSQKTAFKVLHCEIGRAHV